MTKIRRPSQKPPCFHIYGPDKLGKTTLAATAPNALIVDPSHSTSSLGDTAEIWPVDAWSDLREVHSFLRSDGVSPLTKEKYQWVVIDGLDAAVTLLMRQLMGDLGDTPLDQIPDQIAPRDYWRIGAMVRKLLDDFTSLPYPLILVSSEKVDEAETGDMPPQLDEDDPDEPLPATVRAKPNLPPMAKAAANTIPDVVGRLYAVRTTQVQKGRTKQGTVVERSVDVLQRRLWIAPHQAYDTGFRSPKPNVPNYIPNPTITKLVETVRG